MLSYGSEAAPLRFLRLPHPRTRRHLSYDGYFSEVKMPDVNCLFLSYQRRHADGQVVDNLLELQAISPDAQRSWFIEPNQISSGARELHTYAIFDANSAGQMGNYCWSLQSILHSFLDRGFLSHPQLRYVPLRMYTDEFFSNMRALLRRSDQRMSCSRKLRDSSYTLARWRLRREGLCPMTTSYVFVNYLASVWH